MTVERTTTRLEKTKAYGKNKKRSPRRTWIEDIKEVSDKRDIK